MSGVVVLAGGCGQAAGPPAAPSMPAVSSAPARVGASCAALATQGEAVRIPSDDITVAGIVLGHASTAVILVNDTRTDVCSWLTYATELQRLGYQVLAFDPAGTGASTDRHRDGTPPPTDVLAAAKYLRGRGARELALIGAGDGAGAGILAAAKLAPPDRALVGLSSPASLGGADLAPTLRQSRIPAIFFAADQDGPFPAAARSLSAATPSPTRQAPFICGGTDHGTALLIGACAVSAQETVKRFLSAHAPPG
jgi:pimeloyl-ACP methyl ester carboxylesterase